MATLVLDNLPEQLYLGLQERAARHQRSVTDEATAILTDGLKGEGARQWPEPLQTKVPITNDFINWAKREGRE